MGLFDNLFGSKEKNTEANDAGGLQWKDLNSLDGLDAILKRSAEMPCAIFKHSTRCSISSMAKSRLERNWSIEQDAVEIYYLDLIAYRNVSNEIADKLGVVHQSPQIILIKDGQAVYDTSHNGISVEGLQQALSQ